MAKSYLVADSVAAAALFEDLDLPVKEGKPGMVKGKRCHWCGWTTIGFDKAPDHECSGPPGNPPRSGIPYTGGRRRI